MNILLTGASSFTGLWFAEALAGQGLRVIAPLQRAIANYQGTRGARVQRLARVAEIIEECPFGSPAFLALAASREIDVLCHHAAQVTDYKSPDFDAIAALRDNTFQLPQILAALKDLRAVVLTGSVFEADEGIGTEPRQAFSPYGLSKTLTGQVFRYRCARAGIPLTRFIIPNPFGPYEEQRFCHYLMSRWAKRQAAGSATPDYVRDNIHVSLLALAYADAVKRIAGGEAIAHLAPSGYAETQAAFTQRLAAAMRSRLPIDCVVEALPQMDFSEPLARTNKDEPDIVRLGWDEQKTWDDLAAYYRSIYLQP
jgi:nucleoside-diphosphate-sugar epimerase